MGAPQTLLVVYTPAAAQRTSALISARSYFSLYLTVNAAGDQMMLVSLFDNLGKGSSGAAVQCMNLMLGLEETKGLE